jgi:GT2 family glycosyltransferase
VSAVTFACALISASKFWEIGALDENLPSGFNDVDISIRSSNHNYNNVLCVKAELIHREAQTRPKSLSIKGFWQAVKDVIGILRKHPGKIRESFFEPHTFGHKPQSPRKKI